MKELSRRALPAVAALAMLALGSAPAAAESWPTHSIRLIVPFGAGSGTDIVARAVSNDVSEIIGKPIVIENIGGAGGTIGVSRAARAEPDGYTMVIGAVDTFAQSQYLFKEPPSNTLQDFEAVGMVAEQPLVMLVRKDLPVRSLQDFKAYAQAHPGKMSFASAGIGAAPYLACAMINKAVGVQDVTHVPYRAAAPALQDMIAGRLDYYCPLAAAAINFVNDDSLRLLAVLTAERSPLFPGLPTAKEQGVSVTDGYYWNAFFMPRGTPAPILDAMNKALRTALDRPLVQERLMRTAAIAVAPERRSRTYLDEFLRSEITKWAGIMRNADVPQQ